MPGRVPDCEYRATSEHRAGLGENPEQRGTSASDVVLPRRRQRAKLQGSTQFNPADEGRTLFR